MGLAPAANHRGFECSSLNLKWMVSVAELADPLDTVAPSHSPPAPPLGLAHVHQLMGDEGELAGVGWVDRSLDKDRPPQRQPTMP